MNWAGLEPGVRGRGGTTNRAVLFSGSAFVLAMGRLTVRHDVRRDRKLAVVALAGTVTLGEPWRPP